MEQSRASESAAADPVAGIAESYEPAESGQERKYEPFTSRRVVDDAWADPAGPKIMLQLRAHSLLLENRKRFTAWLASARLQRGRNERFLRKAQAPATEQVGIEQ